MSHAFQLNGLMRSVDDIVGRSICGLGCRVILLLIVLQGSTLGSMLGALVLYQVVELCLMLNFR